jgi:LysM repeat protein
MAQLTIFLLLGVLLLPVLGAIASRLIGRGAITRASRLAGIAGFAGAIACVIGLRQMPIDTASLGQLAIFLPSNTIAIPRDAFIELPTAPALASIPDPTATARPRPTRTIEPTAEPTGEPTTTPTSEPTGTPVPEPTSTTAPTAAPPQPTSPPVAQVRRYVVEEGDTLRAIAEQFDVTVEAIIRYNGLTAEEADSLQLGQELLIPPS